MVLSSHRVVSAVTPGGVHVAKKDTGKAPYAAPRVEKVGLVTGLTLRDGSLKKATVKQK